MDLNQLGFAANLIFELCRQHPELCPHQYEWRGSCGPNENGDTVNFTTSATQCKISDNGKNYFCDQLNYEDFTLFFD